MGIVELVLIAFGLSMDAFAVAICKGLGMAKLNYKKIATIALFFGGFQALMPFIGWMLGTRFQSYISAYDHFIAFALLTIIGGKMIVESLKNQEVECENCDTLSLKELLVLAVATSIDALAVGITFALLPGTNILLSVAVIGVIAFILSGIGVAIGYNFGSRWGRKAELFGGVVLVLIGTKILVEHMGWLGF